MVRKYLLMIVFFSPYIVLADDNELLPDLIGVLKMRRRRIADYKNIIADYWEDCKEARRRQEEFIETDMSQRGANYRLFKKDIIYDSS
jgi:hypothetical protein